MLVTLTGANGQLGTDLGVQLSNDRDIQLRRLNQPQFDLTDPANMRSQLLDLRPDLILNTAAYVAVEEAEDKPVDAFLVNAVGVRSLALIARELDCWLVHFSTDYVFDGGKKQPYIEEDLPKPLNVYGNSKLAGEYFVRALTAKHLIVRSAGLYGSAGPRGKKGNFVDTIIARARAGQEIQAVADQVTAPTYTRDLAAATLTLVHQAIRRDHPLSGVYHVTNAGSCSWHQFAVKTLALVGLKQQVRAVTSAQYRAKAVRPAHVVLANQRLQAAGIPQPRPWQEALTAYLREKGQIAGP